MSEPSTVLCNFCGKSLEAKTVIERCPCRPPETYPECERLRAQLAEAQGCPHGGECGCSLMTRHEWWDAHSQERLKREAAEARAAEAEQARHEERESAARLAGQLREKRDLAVTFQRKAEARAAQLARELTQAEHEAANARIERSQAEATVATLRDALAQVRQDMAERVGSGSLRRSDEAVLRALDAVLAGV